MILIMGLRDVSIGTDTIGYFTRYEYLKNAGFGSLSQLLNTVHGDKGYILLEYFIGKYFVYFQIFLLIIAFIYILSVSKTINNNSKSPIISFVLFIGLGFFIFGMSAIRQTLAISFVLMSFESIKKRQLLKYLTFVFIASTFHITAVIFLPIYWLVKLKINYINMIGIFLVAITVFVMKDIIINFLINIYPMEYTQVETGGNRFYLILILSVVLGLFFKKNFLDNNSLNKMLFIIMITSVVIFPVTQFHPAVMRLYWYFTIFSIIYIPNLLMSIRDKSIRLIGICGYILIPIVYFFLVGVNNLNAKDYIFFW
jgi:hypothetical protein